MTAQEIQTLIDSTIKGQGTNIDGGGQLANILSGILELAQNPPIPEKHILKVLDIPNSDNDYTPDEIMPYLELDGKTPTVNDLLDLNISDFIIEFGETTYTPTAKYQTMEYAEPVLTIICGYYLYSEDAAQQIIIRLNEDNSAYLTYYEK